jgi:hypothetical protein
MMRIRAPRFPLQTFRVRIEPHQVAGRWPIPARSVKVPAANAEHARLIVVRTAHSKAGVPPWKPCLRDSLCHTSVTGSSMPVPQSERRAA